MNIAYCVECKPVRVIGAPVGMGPCSHKLSDGAVHKGKVVMVPDDKADRRGATESPEAYLGRLATKYKVKLT